MTVRSGHVTPAHVGVQVLAFPQMPHNLSYVHGLFLFYAVPYLGVLSFRDARVSGYALSVLLMHGIYGYFASFQRNGWRLAPVLPCAAFLYLFALWRSAWITLRQGGVRWRDTFYPLEVLKRGSEPPRKLR